MPIGYLQEVRLQVPVLVFLLPARLLLNVRGQSEDAAPDSRRALSLKVASRKDNFQAVYRRVKRI